MKVTTEKEEEQRFSTRRIEALTDGVFAIAMTLLVLDLKVSDLGTVSTSRELFEHMVEHSQSLLSFAVSFLVLGTLWAVHMRQFELIDKADRRLTTLNTLRLLIVVLVPLATSMAGNYQDLVLGRILLPISFFVLALLSYIQWRYAISPAAQLGGPLLTPELRQESEIRNRSILAMSLLVIVASIWIGDIAFVLLFFLAIPISLLRSRQRKAENI